MNNSRKFIENISHGKRFWLFCAFLSTIFAFNGHAQRLSAAFLEYIDTYKEYAQLYQVEYGVPASVTLAQGLLESAAGRSYLATETNNHFGIKCHQWEGEGVMRQGDCYRKYETAQDSYLDHAKFLCMKRYQPLHELKITDYKGWANGLRRLGYAEDPAYASLLIKLIEQYELYQYDINPEAALAAAQHAKHTTETSGLPQRKSKHDVRNVPPPNKIDRNGGKQHQNVPQPKPKAKAEQKSPPPPSASQKRTNTNDQVRRSSTRSRGGGYKGNHNSSDNDD